MDKSTEIKFVGQPVFKQILNLIDQVNIQGLINKHQSDRLAVTPWEMERKKVA